MRKLSLILASTCLVPAVDAQRNEPTQAAPSAIERAIKSTRGFRRLEIPGAEVEKAVSRLTKEMRWHKTLGGALATGRAKGKPVVWIQALGDLDGFL